METRSSRRYRSRQERREIVEETFKPGASVSRVARAHNVNANQVFHWRRLHREGLLDEVATKSAALVPVRITSEIDPTTSAGESSKTTRPKGTGMIEIAFGSIRVRIEGSADPACVRAVMDGLGR